MIKTHSARQSAFWIFILGIVFMIFAIEVLAEGAVRVLECSVEEACDAGGACEPAKGEVVFEMSPLKLDAMGAGSYDLDYGDVQVSMEARSFAGPFLWTDAGKTHTLLANSETSFLWHRLAFEPAPAAEMLFLSCNFTQ